MYIQRPIFVNGFSRGGTTMLTNLLASHPDVCTLGETHHLFKGTTITDRWYRIVQKCLWHDLPILLAQREDFFSPRSVRPRKPLNAWAKRWVDRVLYCEKLRSLHPRLNLFKDECATYSANELRDGRMLGKNIDGMIYATDSWRDLYPDAVFFGLVRNGLALCEGHLRRGRSAKEIGWRYRVLVEKMLRDAIEIPNYYLLRFEDLVARPWDVLIDSCLRAGLEPHRIKCIRMQVRRVMDAQGRHQLSGHREWDVVWLKPLELASYFEGQVNQHQIQRLSLADRDAFLSQAGATMERLGYSISLESSFRPLHSPDHQNHFSELKAA